MADAGVIETEELLKEVERNIDIIYTESIKSLQKELRDVMDKFQKEDEQQHQRWMKGEITQADYVDWRQKALMRGKHYGDMISTLSDDLTRSDILAMSAVQRHMPEVYALNANYGTYEIESGSGLNTSWTLYDRHTVENLMRNNPDLLPMPEVDIPKDNAWNMKHFNNCISQGILKGDSIDKIAQSLETVAGMGRSAAIRNARTATTCAQNAGRVSSYKRAEALGIKMVQEWQSGWDNRVRHEHRLLDGQRRKVGEKFSVGREEIEYPGDPRASSHMIYNCRCTLVAVLDGYDHDSKAGFNNGSQTYEEWKYELGSGATVEADSGLYPEYSRIFRMTSTPVTEAQKTNPNYSSFEYEYTHNCQRCVGAWEFRMRGYDVIAMPCKPENESDPYMTSVFSIWDFNAFDPDKTKTVHRVKTGNGKEDIISFLKECGNGARVEISVDWDESEWGHAFAAQNENGNIVFYDPQNGQHGSYVEKYFDKVKIGETRFLRIDNKPIRESARMEVMRSAY